MGDERERMSTAHLLLLLDAGRGLTCDGVKAEKTETTFYDFILHCIQIKESSSSTWKRG